MIQAQLWCLFMSIPNLGEHIKPLYHVLRLLLSDMCLKQVHNIEAQI
jgi:hypothetical protein